MALQLRCPAQFYEFRSEILTSCLNHMYKQTESLPPPSLFFSDKLYGRFKKLYFFVSLYRSYLQQKNEIRWCRLSICCLVHDKHRVKKHMKMPKIERSIAKHRLCQHHNWPSSQTSTLYCKTPSLLYPPLGRRVGSFSISPTSHPVPHPCSHTPMSRVLYKMAFFLSLPTLPSLCLSKSTTLSPN